MGGHAILPVCLSVRPSVPPEYRTTFGCGKKMECAFNRARLEEEEEEFEVEWDVDEIENMIKRPTRACRNFIADLLVWYG